MGRFTSSLAAVLFAFLALSDVASAAIEWQATAEPGNHSEWSGAQVPGDDVATFAPIVTSPVFGGSKSFGLTARPGAHVNGEAPERAQLNGPHIHQRGEEDYTAVAVFVPANYPTTDATGFWQTAWQFHAAPFIGSPPIEMGVSADGSRMDISHNWWPGRDGQHSTDPAQRNETVGSVPITRGVWQKFVWRVRWSPLDSDGFFELWSAREGQPLTKVTFANGQQRVTGATMLAAMTGGQQPHADNYRKAGVLPESTLYFDSVRTASTFDEAAAAFPDTPKPAPYEVADTAARSYGDAPSVDLMLPPETQRRDVLVAVVVTQGESPVTAPEGFIGRCWASLGTAGSRMVVFTKLAVTGDAGATVRFDAGSRGTHVVGLHVSRGGSHERSGARCANRGTGNDVESASGSPTEANGLILTGAASSNGARLQAPLGTAQSLLVRTGTTAADRALALGREVWPTTNYFGPRLYTDLDRGLGATGIAGYAVAIPPL